MRRSLVCAGPGSTPYGRAQAQGQLFACSEALEERRITAAVTALDAFSSPLCALALAIGATLRGATGRRCRTGDAIPGSAWETAGRRCVARSVCSSLGGWEQAGQAMPWADG